MVTWETLNSKQWNVKQINKHYENSTKNSFDRIKEENNIKEKNKEILAFTVERTVTMH